MSQQDNIKTQQAFGEAVNSGNLNAIRDLVAPDAVDHDPAPDQGNGPEVGSAADRTWRGRSSGVEESGEPTVGFGEQEGTAGGRGKPTFAHTGHSPANGHWHYRRGRKKDVRGI